MTPKFYAGCMPYHKADRERLEQVMREAGRNITIPEPSPDHKPVDCSGCGMTLSMGPTLQQRMQDRPEEELVPICPACMALEQKRTKQQITVENVESSEKQVLCSCGTALKHGER